MDNVHIKLPLSLAQLTKIRQGKQIQIDPHHGSSSKTARVFTVALHPSSAEKYMKAAQKSKKCRILISASEIAQSGEGLREILAGIRSGAQKVGQFIKSDLYQQNFKPLARKAVDAGLAASSAVVPGILSDPLKSGVNWVGRETGAYGIPLPDPGAYGKGMAKKKAPKKKAPKKPRGGSFRLN